MLADRCNFCLQLLRARHSCISINLMITCLFSTEQLLTTSWLSLWWFSERMLLLLLLLLLLLWKC
jgi:hypothetical protein